MPRAARRPCPWKDSKNAPHSRVASKVAADPAAIPSAAICEPRATPPRPPAPANANANELISGYLGYYPRLTSSQRRPRIPANGLFDIVHRIGGGGMGIVYEAE